MRGTDTVPYGLLLVLAGFALVFVGIVVSVARSLLSEGDVEAEAGGVVFVGPIPIVFGTSKGVVWMALAIAIVMLVFFFVFYR